MDINKELLGYFPSLRQTLDHQTTGKGPCLVVNPMSSSVVPDHPLAKLYVESNKKVFLNAIDGAESHWPTCYSPNFRAHSKGKTLTAREFLDGMNGMKSMFSNIQISYQSVVVSGRSVGSSEEVEMKKISDGSTVRFKAIIVVTFGEGEEEDKIVDLVEVVEE